MTFSIEVIISIISALVAIISALFAWQAARTAEKTYSIELIGQLYSTYQSDEMLKNLRINWDIYRKLWVEVGTDSEENLINNANYGVLLPTDKAVEYFKGLDPKSEEFKAIHHTINFWTYVELLLIKKSVTPKEIKSFTSATILGFLIPMSKAYSIRYPGSNLEEKNVLEYTYKALVETT